MNNFEEVRELFGESVAKKKFKIVYDKKINNLRAKVELIQTDGLEYDIKPIGLNGINDALRIFINFKGTNLKTLVDTKQISMDDFAKLGYEFDYENGLLVEKRITMADRIKLAEMEKENKDAKKTKVIEMDSAKSEKEPVVPKKDEKREPFTVTPVEEKTEEKKDPVIVAPVVTETKEIKKELDGSVEVEGTHTEREEKKTRKSKKVTNLKTYGKAAAILLVGAVVAWVGLKDVIKGWFNRRTDDDSNNDQYEENTNEEYGQVYNDSNDEVMRVSYDDNGGTNIDIDRSNYYYGSIIEYDSMENQVQEVNDICFNYQPCTLYDRVVESDRDAIYVIINMRNRVLNGTCDIEDYLNNVVNYLFENGTIFDGKVIKSYDSLRPFARYIVLASSQSILQTHTKYEHITPNGEYSYPKLTNSYEYLVDEAYRAVTNRSSYGR